MEIKTSIDKISFICDCPSFSSKGKHAVKFWELFRKHILNRSSFERKDMFYRHNCTYNEVFVSFGMNEHGVDDKLRLEFNPNRVKIFDVLSIIVFIGPHSLNGIKVTRLDYAVDYLFDFNPLGFYDKFKRKGCVHFGEDGVETVYLGAKSSSGQIRIYDKRKQMMDEYKEDIGHAQWRIESQDRRPFSLFGESNDNPFKNLIYIDLFDTDGLEDFQRVFVALASRIGMNSAMAYVHDKHVRDRELRVVKSRLVKDFVTPAEMWDRDYKYQLEKLKGQLNDGSVSKLH